MLTLNVALFAQAILPTKVEGRFSAPLWRPFQSPNETRLDNPDFANGLSLTFSFTMNVPQQGSFLGYVSSLDSLNPEPFTIGTTDFSRKDVGAFSQFQDGQLVGFWIGGLVDGVSSVNSNWVDPYPSDFMLIYRPEIDSSLFLYQVNGYFSQLRGTDFDASVNTSTAQPVPEAASFGFGAGVMLLVLAIFRKVGVRFRTIGG